MKKFFVISLILLLGACAGKNTTSDFNPADHFLGNDYSQLKAIPDLKGGLGWRSPEFNAADYTAMYIEPVVLWHAEDMSKESGFKPEELEALATYFHDVLTRVPDGQKLQLAAQPGPGVISVQAAVTEVEASSPVSNALTSVVPIGILLSAGKQAATGQAMGVGKCAIEMRFVDSVSGEKLALFAETKVGKKYSSSGFSKAGQTEEAMDEWATLMKERIDAVWGQGM
jgi:hypothetical protein